VYPLGAPDGMLTADDAATVASAAVGAITIPGGGGSGEKLLFYAASLHAFDPATPETLLTVDAGNTHGGNFMPFGVLTADWSTAGPYPTAVNPRIPYVLYERAGAPEGDIDHRLFMVSTAKVGEGETPLPMQVASGHAGPICDFEIGLDFTDAMKARLVFQAAGAGRDCDDPDAGEPWRFARLDTPETEAPLALPVGFFPITATLSDPATGAHHGWLGVQEEMEELTLVHYDPDFTTATPLKTGLLPQTGFGAPGIADELASTVDGKVFLNLDGGLYLYDIADEQAPGVGTLSAKLRDFSYKPLGAATGRPLAVGGDRAGGMYFLDTTPVRLYGVDGSGVVTPLATPAGATDFDQIAGGHTIVAADDRVVFSYRRPIATQRLASVKKDATGLLELDSGLLVLLNTSGLGAGDTVFYTKTAAIDALPSAVAAPADGSGALVSREGANWIGFTASGTGL
ncbi:MAG: hypothetical protein K8I02_05140, partial [Candidatus Methylomirabilis sp.]|nr:hypothetical protein [Deltaproteobacteria bacterium]